MNPYDTKILPRVGWNQFDYQSVQRQVIQQSYFRILYLSDDSLDIDCYCDGVLMASNLKHGNALNYLLMTPGYHQLIIERNSDGKQQVLLVQDVLVYGNEYMTLCVVEKNKDIHLYAIIDEPYPMKDKIQKIRVVNFTTLAQLDGILSEKPVVTNLNAFQMTPYIQVVSDETERFRVESPLRGNVNPQESDLDFSKSTAQTIYIIDGGSENQVSLVKLKDGTI